MLLQSSKTQTKLRPVFLAQLNTEIDREKTVISQELSPCLVELQIQDEVWFVF